MKKHFLLTVFVYLLGMLTLNCQGQSSQIYYVDSAKADNSGDGLSWATAKKDIQAALNITVSGNQVWVKTGTYYPTVIPAGLTAGAPNSPVSNRDKTLLLKDGVKLYGGFTGTESTLAERIPGSNRTIIDGDIGTPGDSTDNCYHLMVYLGSYSSSGVTIDGFTLRNGTAGTWGGTVPPYDAASLTVGGIPYSIVRTYGGGIYLQQGLNNFVNNVVFEKNYAKNRAFGLWTDGGFGLTCSYTVTNCYFVNNYGIESTYGCWATNFGKNYGYNLVFYDNHIFNFGFGAGVGIFLYDGINSFVNCSFVSNSSIMGGVVNLANGAKSYFTNCLFYNNKQSPVYNPSNPDAPDFFDSEFAGSFGKFTNCSMSAPATFYTTTNYTMAAGSAGNIFNQNPAFANINSVRGTDGKYFTADDGLALPASSPCKNAGNNDSVAVTLTKDITGASRIMSTAVDIGPYEIDAVVACTPPAAPTASNQTFCDSASATVANLSASGSNIKWYAAATGGSPLSASMQLTDGTKYYASQTTGGCESILRAVDSVTVFANGVPAPVAANQRFCSGATVADLSATGTNIKWYLVPTGGTALPGTTALTDGTKYYASQTIGNCESAARAVDSVALNNLATVNPVRDTTVCNGSNIPAINFTTTTVGGTVTYAWTNDNTGIGLAANGNGNITGFTATNPFGGPVTATIIVTPTITNAGVSCEGVKDTFLITVNPAIAVPVIANQVVCNGSFTSPVIFGRGRRAPLAYNWTNDQPSIGLAASGSGSIASFTAVNNGTAPVVATITVTPAYTNGGVTCDGTARTFTITVNPTATMNAVANQVVCNGSPVTTINFTTTASGGTVVYNWTNDNPSIGLAAGDTGNIASFIATNTGNLPETATITVTPDYTNAGVTCTGIPLTFTITVNPTPTVSQPAGQTLCANTATAPVNFAGAVAGTIFTWTNNNPSIGLAASGTGDIPSFTALNPSNVPVTAAIVVTPNYTNAGTTCAGSTKTFTITVNPIPTVAAVTNKTYCTGATTLMIPFNGTVGNLPGTVYNWTNSNPAIGLAASGTGDIAPFVTTNTSNGPLVATITVIRVDNTGCVGTPTTFTITVNPTPVINPVAGQVFCNGQPAAAINFTSATTGPTGALSFQWTNSAPSIGLAANGTGNIAAFTAVNTGLSPVTALITVTPVYSNAGITCTGTAQTFTLVVNPTPTVNPVVSQTVCNGANTAAVNFAGSVSGTIYNWTNNNTSIGLAVSGAGNIASFVASNATNTAQTATITVTPNFSNGVTCPGTPVTFTITVNPNPSVNPVASQAVCAGATVTQAFAGTVAGTIYNWTNNNPAIGLSASGTGNFNFIATNTTNAPLSATITVTPSFTNGGITCTGAAQNFTITVNPVPTVNAVAPQVLCNGSAATAVNFTGNVPGTVYNWTNTNTSIGLAAAGTGNIAGFTAVNATVIPQVAIITVTPTFTNGATTCTGTPITFTIMVNPTPAVNTIANQAVCNGAATTAVTFAGAVAGTVYNWTNSNPLIGLAASGNNTIPSFTAINTGSTPVTATITVTPTFTNGGISCTGASTSFTVTVNPTATVNQPANQLLCNGSFAPAISFTGNVAATNYTWTNSNTAIGLPAAGTGSIPSFAATNNTAAPIMTTITVTPSSAAGCTGIPVSFTVSVSPTPSVNAIAGQTVCSGSATAPVTISGPAAGTVYTWTNDNTSIGLAASGTGNVPAFTAVNSTTTPVTATITVTPAYTNAGVTCTGPVRSFTITVNPLPKIVFGNIPARVCLTDTIINLQATPGGVWSGPGISGNTFSAAAAGQGVATLTYTLSNSNNCISVATATIMVNDCIERHNMLQAGIKILSNPNNGRFGIKMLSDKYAAIHVTILDALGQQLKQYQFNGLSYGSTIPIDVHELPAATYFLEASAGPDRAAFRFVIVR